MNAIKANGVSGKSCFLYIHARENQKNAKGKFHLAELEKRAWGQSYNYWYFLSVETCGWKERQ